MIDRKFIGHAFPAHTTDVEKGRLRFFAKAIGETNPIYTEESAAKDAGYRAIPAPPTYLFCLEMLDVADPFVEYEKMGIHLSKILHGEQTFHYYQPVCAGDTLHFQSKVTDIYEKKGGALQFVVQDTEAKNQSGDLVAELRRVFVVRNTH